MGQSIAETQVKSADWVRKHINSMKMTYGKSPHFSWFEERLFPLLAEQTGEVGLSAINRRLLKLVIEDLDIPARLQLDEQFELHGDANTKLLQICSQLEATEYLSGPAGAAYLDEMRFADHGVKVSYVDYGPVFSFLGRNKSSDGPPLSIVDTIAQFGIGAIQDFLEEQRLYG